MISHHKHFNKGIVYDIIKLAQGGSQMEKQIIAALEIADREVRLLVGQFYNGRLNILKVERVSHLGVVGYTIMSESIIVDAIKKAVENASRNLGVVIESVILMVPGIHMKRLNKQLHVPIAGRVSELDIRRAYRELLNSQAPESYILTNVLFSKYFVNGSSTRKMPLNERCESIAIEADCYYGKQSIIFPYVGCVEASGLRIIDIVLDDLAFAKESSLFEASIDKPIIALTFAEKITKFSLYHQGSLLSNDYVDKGFDVFMRKLENTLKIPQDVVHGLIYYNLDLLNTAPLDDPIFIWSTKSTSHTLSQKDLSDILGEDIKAFIEDIADRISPIFNLGDPKIVITGEASEVSGLEELIESNTNAETTAYRSTTFGVKDRGLSSLVGAFYYYKDLAIYRTDSLSSISETEFKRVVLQSDGETDEEDSLTKKLKHMFFDR